MVKGGLFSPFEGRQLRECLVTSWEKNQKPSLTPEYQKHINPLLLRCEPFGAPTARYRYVHDLASALILKLKNLLQDTRPRLPDGPPAGTPNLPLNWATVTNPLTPPLSSYHLIIIIIIIIIHVFTCTSRRWGARLNEIQDQPSYCGTGRRSAGASSSCLNKSIIPGHFFRRYCKVML